MAIYLCKIYEDRTVELNPEDDPQNEYLEVKVDSEKDSLGRHYYPSSGYLGQYTIKKVAEYALEKSEITTLFLEDRIIKRVEVATEGGTTKGVYKLYCPIRIDTTAIGKIVCKRSKNPFKSGNISNTVKGFTVNPNTGKDACTFFEDDSIVDLDILEPLSTLD